MLHKPKNPGERLQMELRKHCAEDSEVGAYLMRSNGHRKANRLRKYWYRTPNMINARVIFASSDDDAIFQIDGDIASVQKSK